MWNAITEIKFFTEVSSDKKRFLEKLIDLYAVPERGILIVLDSDDYVDYPNPIWRNQGLHLNIKKGGVEEMSPEDLLEVMESREYSNLVWLSKRICDADLIKFIWVASHEFQHFCQSRLSHELSVANTFLYETLGDKDILIKEPKVAITIPAEFDAELAAFRTTIKLFGREEAEKFVKQPRRYNKIGVLLSYDENNQYDIIGKTIYFLEKYREQLLVHIQRSNDPMKKSFNLDHHTTKLKELKSHNIGLQATRFSRA